MHVLNNYCYDNRSVIHKKHEVTPVPIHLKSLIINNTITNNFNVNISDCTTGICFFETNYKRGGMYPLVDMRQHPEWIPGYRKHVEVKRITICRSCKKRSIKECCPEYSSKNRTMQTMVIGWHK